MASDIRRIVFNTRERLTSTDFNDMTALQHRALIESLAAVSHGETAQFGVIRGLQVNVVPATLTVTVSPGIALRSGTAPTSYDSDIEWIELPEAEVIDLSSYVHGVNPRWVVIEIADADVVELNTSRDVFQPATGTFASSAVDKVRGSEPVISVTAGTAAATPYFPAGTAGRIPLAYVYIPALAASLSSTGTILCRPIMVPGNMALYQDTARQVEGGGIYVGATPSAAVSVCECRGYIGDSVLPFQIGRITETSALNAAHTITAADFDGAALPAADGPVYFYAIRPPYPSGYDSNLSDRECVMGVGAELVISALGKISFKNCVVIASEAEPNLASRAGAPTSGSFTVNAAPWASAPVTVSRLQSVYLGAASFNQASAVFHPQFKHGEVLSFLMDGAVTPGNMPSTPIHDGTSFSTGTINLWDDGFAARAKMPVTARRVECRILVSTGTSTGHRLTFTEETGQSYTFATNGGSGTNINLTYPWTANVNSDGEIEFSSAAAVAADTDLNAASIISTGYTDCIISSR